MVNMGYCRFQNTYRDLVDCYEHLWDNDFSLEEEKYRQMLISICQEIAGETENA